MLVVVFWIVFECKHLATLVVHEVVILLQLLLLGSRRGSLHLLELHQFFGERHRLLLLLMRLVRFRVVFIVTVGTTVLVSVSVVVVSMVVRRQRCAEVIPAVRAPTIFKVALVAPILI